MDRMIRDSLVVFELEKFETPIHDHTLISLKFTYTINITFIVKKSKNQLNVYQR